MPAKIFFTSRVQALGQARGSQDVRAMAAVLCLVLLPLVAACGFMIGVVGGELSAASVFCGLAFLLLGGGMIVGMFNMARTWENEPPH